MNRSRSFSLDEVDDFSFEKVDQNRSPVGPDPNATLSFKSDF